MKKKASSGGASRREKVCIELDADTLTLVRECARREGVDPSEVLSYLVRECLGDAESAE